MSQWIVPNRNRPHQTRRQPGEEEDGNRSSHVHFPQKNLSLSNRLVSMPKYEAMELAWESGQQELVVDRHGELLLPMPSAKHSWGQSDDTLESIVRQATTVVDKRSSNLLQHGHTPAHISSTAPPPSGGEYFQSSIHEPIAAPLSRKRTWSNPECYEGNTATSNSMHAEHDDLSYCGGASARSCRDKDASLMSWASLESHRSLKTKNPIDDFARDDVSEEEHDIKGKTDGCSSTKRTRAAINHNQSERRRRDRINQRMKDLQELVPNGSKTDRASLLDDTIQYLKQLQAQIQFMCSIRTVPQMVMPLGMQQQQLQIALLGRMGLLDGDSMARSTAQSVARLLQPPCAAAFAPPPVLVPSMRSTAKPKANLSTGAFVPPADPFCSLLAQQSMNMDLYSKMVTLYCQEVNKTPHQTSKSIQAQRIEGIKEDMR